MLFKHWRSVFECIFFSSYFFLKKMHIHLVHFNPKFFFFLVSFELQIVLQCREINFSIILINFCKLSLSVSIT